MLEGIMKHKKHIAITRILVPSLFAAAGALTPHTASAALISYAQDFAESFYFGSEVAGDFRTNFTEFSLLNLPQFDAALGTLRSVDFRFDTGLIWLFEGSDTDTRNEFGTSIPFPPIYLDPYNDAGLDATAQGRLSMQLLNASAPSLFDYDFSRSANCYLYEEQEGPTTCVASVQQRAEINGFLPVVGLPLSDFSGNGNLSLLTSMTGSFSGHCDDDDLRKL
jgi:hypothetical protein